ncbi:hypothetical protein IFM89_014539 [Coptis chinensis]|uniref:Protein GAMETE EXPRESSED 3 n=1 Tax=Coptis chinensis TaxID=261450 RepID=A0A835H591_9MAGN|nr:hypothetical protein IFM89_014539 [Coptis chinensis]
MPNQFLCLLLLLMVLGVAHSTPRTFRKPTYRLTKPLIGDDGKVYTCSERNLFAFESNGTIAWDVHMDYACQADIAPVIDERGKIYLIAENRVLKIMPANIGTAQSAVEVFFSNNSIAGGSVEIIGIAVSSLSSCMFINVKNRGLFGYTLRGDVLWLTLPVLYRFGYRQGCKKGDTDCYFTSVPVVDQCEGSIYISNNQGELYSLSMRTPQYKWIQDFTAFDKLLIITAGNNGLVYVTVPVSALVFALDAITGSLLWQKSIGPLSTADCSPVVDLYGYISIGSLDGFLYSYSPSGNLKKFPKSNNLDSVVQVSPVLDCSGYAVYISQTRMEKKISHTSLGDSTYISAMKPINTVFSLLVPATGNRHWTGKYPGKVSLLLSEGDTDHFALDERILLAFIAAANVGSSMACRSTSQKTTSTCIQAKIRHLSIYTGNERAILFFLLFETVVLALLVVLIRFCCIFWRKKKLQDRDLGKFLEKRRSLQVRKKVFDRTITELEQKAAEEAVGSEVLEKLGDLVKEREGIERKLSTTYSFGKDRAKQPQVHSVLPLYGAETTKSYSFQGRKKESVSIFHTVSDASSRERSTSDASNSSSNNSNDSVHPEEEAQSYYYFGDIESTASAKVHTEIGTSSSAGIFEEAILETSLHPSARLKGFENPLFPGKNLAELREVEQHVEDFIQKGSSSRNSSLKRRRSLSLTN